MKIIKRTSTLGISSEKAQKTMIFLKRLSNWLIGLSRAVTQWLCVMVRPVQVRHTHSLDALRKKTKDYLSWPSSTFGSNWRRKKMSTKSKLSSKCVTLDFRNWKIFSWRKSKNDVHWQSLKTTTIWSQLVVQPLRSLGTLWKKGHLRWSRCWKPASTIVQYEKQIPTRLLADHTSSSQLRSSWRTRKAARSL